MKSPQVVNRRESRASQLPGSLNRAVTLLTAIARGSPQGSTLCQLVARTSLPRPTIHRVLSTLITLGWVFKDSDSGRYNLGIDLSALGVSAVARNPIEKIASPYLERLVQDINQVVYLNIRTGLDMVCVGRYANRDQVHSDKGWVGMRGPLGMTPGCIGMFSKMSREEVGEIINLNLSRYYKIEGFDERGFRTMVERCLNYGDTKYENIMLDKTRKGVGVPICDISGYPVAGIGMNYIVGSIDDQTLNYYLNYLRAVAGDIESKVNSLSSRLS